MERIAFLDRINSLLWEILNEKPNCQKPSIQDILSSNNLDLLLLYKSSELEAVKDPRTDNFVKIIRRKLAVPPINEVIFPLDAYANLLKIYLDSNSTFEDLRFYSNSIQEKSIITKLLLLSKSMYQNDFSKGKKSLAKTTIRDASKHNISFTCLYVYLYRCLNSTNNHNYLSEYEAFFQSFTPTNESRNFYIKLLFRSGKKENYKKIIEQTLSTNNIYYGNLIDLSNYINKLVDVDWILIKEDLEKIIVHIKNNQFAEKEIVLPKIEKNLEKIYKKITQKEKKELKAFKFIDIENLHTYKANKYLNQEIIKLIELSFSKNYTGSILSDIDKSILYSEALTSQLILTFLSSSQKKDNKTTSHLYHFIHEKSMNRYYKTMIEDSLLPFLKNKEIFKTILIKQKKYMELFNEIEKGNLNLNSINEEILLKIVSAINNKKRGIDLIRKYTKDKNQLYNLADKLGFKKILLSVDLTNLINSFDLLKNTFIEDILSNTSSNNAHFNYLIDTIIGLKERGISILATHIVDQLHIDFKRVKYICDIVDEALQLGDTNSLLLYFYYFNELIKNVHFNENYSNNFSKQILFLDKALVFYINFVPFYSCIISNTQRQFIQYLINKFNTEEKRKLMHTIPFWNVRILNAFINNYGDTEDLIDLDKISRLLDRLYSFDDKERIIFSISQETQDNQPPKDVSLFDFYFIQIFYLLNVAIEQITYAITEKSNTLKEELIMFTGIFQSFCNRNNFLSIFKRKNKSFLINRYFNSLNPLIALSLREDIKSIEFRKYLQTMLLRNAHKSYFDYKEYLNMSDAFDYLRYLELVKIYEKNPERMFHLHASFLYQLSYSILQEDSNIITITNQVLHDLAFLLDESFQYIDAKNARCLYELFVENFDEVIKIIDLSNQQAFIDLSNIMVKLVSIGDLKNTIGGASFEESEKRNIAYITHKITEIASTISNENQDTEIKKLLPLLDKCRNQNRGNTMLVNNNEASTSMNNDIRTRKQNKQTTSKGKCIF